MDSLATEQPHDIMATRMLPRNAIMLMRGTPVRRRTRLGLRLQSTLQPSTLDHGFKLQPQPLTNPYTSDLAYQRVLSWYLPPDILEEIKPQLIKFGDEAISEQVNEWISDAERNQPYVKKRDVWNNQYPHDKLITSHGWKELGKWGISNGVVAHAYEDKYGEHRRIVQHAFNYIYSASSAVYSCPVSMTSGAGRLFWYQTTQDPKVRDKADHPFHEVHRKLTARKDNWISSQWMTERPGGSDVQNSETVAVYSPLSEQKGVKRFQDGDYLVSGYKFFCSATDCDIALMLAKEPETGKLGLFVAPTKIEGEDGRSITNGIRFHRLKTKMGTKELPTAELELKDVRAWRVGPPGRGIATIAMLLNTTRTHNFITALSCWRRGMAIAKSFAQTRTSLNQPLSTFPMHLRLLSRMEIRFRALLNLAFFTTSLLSFSDNNFPSQSSTIPLPSPGHQTQTILRTLTATSKGVICKLSCIALQECQEAMGGVGYMDEPDEPEWNVSRLYRDTAANMTWEGTTNVLSSEVVRHLMNKDHLEVFGSWVETSVNGVEDEEMKGRLMDAWKEFVNFMEDRREDLSALLADGREIMFSLAWIVSGVLLAHDAQRDGDVVAGEVAKRWILDCDVGVGEFGLHDVVLGQPRVRRRSDREMINWDCKIVWDRDLPGDAAAGYRVEGPGAGEGRVRPAL